MGALGESRTIRPFLPNSAGSCDAAPRGKHCDSHANYREENFAFFTGEAIRPALGVHMPRNGEPVEWDSGWGMGGQVAAVTAGERG